MSDADIPRAELLAAIERQRDTLLDLDIVVDDRRRELAAAEAAEQDAVRERDRAARHLRDLLDLVAAESEHGRGAGPSVPA